MSAKKADANGSPVAVRPENQGPAEKATRGTLKYVDDQFGSGGLFFSSNIETAVDSLIESRDIDLQVSTFVPEGPDAGSVITDKDRAVAIQSSGYHGPRHYIKYDINTHKVKEEIATFAARPTA